MNMHLLLNFAEKKDLWLTHLEEDARVWYSGYRVGTLDRQVS